MGIPRNNENKEKNKYDDNVKELNEHQDEEQKKTDQALKAIIGSNDSNDDMKIITLKNGKTRKVKIPEKRKSLPVYIPESLYEKFEEKMKKNYEKSANAVICNLIKEYVEH